MTVKTKATIAIILGMIIGLVCGCNTATEIQKVENFVNIVKPSIDAIAVVVPVPQVQAAIAIFDAAWGPLQVALDRWKTAALVNPQLANSVPQDVLAALQAFQPGLDSLLAAAGGTKYEKQIVATVSLTESLLLAVLASHGLSTQAHAISGPVPQTPKEYKAQVA